jgi:hypothetical protein
MDQPPAEEKSSHLHMKASFRYAAHLMPTAKKPEQTQFAYMTRVNNREPPLNLNHTFLTTNGQIQTTPRTESMIIMSDSKLAQTLPTALWTTQ